jgi:hypothetical protein
MRGGRIHRGAIAVLDGRFRDRARGGTVEPDRPRWVLFTEYVAPPLGRHLRKERIAFADACGNVHLWGPGLFVWVAGNKPTARVPRAPRLGRAAAAKVLFALLQDPHRAQLPYRHLAVLADVAPDTVHAVFTDLQHKGLLKTWGTRRRELTRLPDIVELWTRAYQDGLRNKLNPKRCVRLGNDPFELKELPALAPKALRLLLGGEMAAGELTGVIRPTHITLHVPAGKQSDVMRAMRLTPHPDGATTLLDTFGMTNEWTPPRATRTPFADPLLIHAELLCTGDDRAREAAEEVYRRYVAERLA